MSNEIPFLLDFFSWFLLPINNPSLVLYVFVASHTYNLLNELCSTVKFLIRKSPNSD